jgi:hypothetical protein
MVRSLAVLLHLYLERRPIPLILSDAIQEIAFVEDQRGRKRHM